MISPENVGIVYNSQTPQAKTLAHQLADSLGLGEASWIVPAYEGERPEPPSALSLIITVGGDGTILWTTQIVAPRGIPILGVNLGRVGFMTELGPEEALTRLGEYLNGDTWIEERTMLQARILPEEAPGPEVGPFHALNEVVVGRRAISRLVHLEARVNGATVTAYRADAVIVATATGSTGYSLSVGGPILHPQSRDLLVQPVAPHLGLAAALVLPQESVVEITLRSERPAVVSIDGRGEMDLAQGQRVEIRRGPYTARFLRANPPGHFYTTLTRRLKIYSDVSAPPPPSSP
ncbi:MAG: NAD(+)/NADH kinase [Chloroflexi bacterium]|nr:NAD(+)/NADH kinase [Chloroflexota bacterium]